jgi:alpha-tubulin suppressor-like RCC1 family protein
MLVQDKDDRVYMVGQKLHYTPSLINFDPEVLDVTKIRMMGCGRKHYIIVNSDNNLMVWGKNFFKDTSETFSEGFSFHYGDTLFDDGQIEQLEVKYGIFGALVKH